MQLYCAKIEVLACSGLLTKSVRGKYGCDPGCAEPGWLIVPVAGGGIVATLSGVLKERLLRCG